MVIVFFALYSFVNDSIVLGLGDSQENNSIIFRLLSLFTIIEFCVFALIIYWCLNIRKLKIFILFVSPIFIIFSIFQFLNSTSFYIDSLSITIENLIIICFAILYFYEQLAIPQNSFIYNSFRFWLILGILIYSTGTFFFFLQSDKLTDAQWEDWSLINYFCTILKIIFFSVAILMKKDNSDNIYKENPLLDDIFEKSFEFDPNNPD